MHVLHSWRHNIYCTFGVTAEVYFIESVDGRASGATTHITSHLYGGCWDTYGCRGKGEGREGGEVDGWRGGNTRSSRWTQDHRGGHCLLLGRPYTPHFQVLPSAHVEQGEISSAGTEGRVKDGYSSRSQA